VALTLEISAVSESTTEFPTNLPMPGLLNSIAGMGHPAFKWAAAAACTIVVVIVFYLALLAMQTAVN
jgi:hypothetical protein